MLKRPTYMRRLGMMLNILRLLSLFAIHMLHCFHCWRAAAIRLSHSSCDITILLRCLPHILHAASIIFPSAMLPFWNFY
jgi:hypothetical protein